MNHSRPQFFLVIGVALTGLVLGDVMLWWILSSTNAGTFQDLVIRYLGYYPGRFQNAVSLTVISIVAGLTASVCFLRIADTQSGVLKSMANVLAAINLGLVCLHVFSLM